MKLCTSATMDGQKYEARSLLMVISSAQWPEILLPWLSLRTGRTKVLGTNSFLEMNLFLLLPKYYRSALSSRKHLGLRDCTVGLSLDPSLGNWLRVNFLMIACKSGSFPCSVCHTFMQLMSKDWSDSQMFLALHSDREAKPVQKN